MKERDAKFEKFKSVELAQKIIKEMPTPAKRLLIIKNCVLSLSMPGASSGVVTKSFREGQIIYDPCSIEQLLENDMPVEILG